MFNPKQYQIADGRTLDQLTYKELQQELAKAIDCIEIVQTYAGYTEATVAAWQLGKSYVKTRKARAKRG